MKNMELWIRRFFLVCYDICVVVISCLLALMARFDFHFEWVPANYLNMCVRIMWIASFVTILCFTLFRLYSSLWTYAGSTELMYICSACFVDDVILTIYVHVLHPSVTYPMPRSFYVFYGLFLMLFTIFGRYFYRTLRMMRAKMTGQNVPARNRQHLSLPFPFSPRTAGIPGKLR